ncbi:hypothetical protein Avbf_05725 [Armadillidium vulgare]|nr:hypothetical protein Avbf_05725 [Armadillidium vulgare]
MFGTAHTQLFFGGVLATSSSPYLKKLSIDFARHLIITIGRRNIYLDYLENCFVFFASGVFLSISMNSLIIFLTSVEHATFVFKNIYIRGFPTTTLTTFLFFSMMAEGGNDFLGYRRSKEKPKLN